MIFAKKFALQKVKVWRKVWIQHVNTTQKKLEQFY